MLRSATYFKHDGYHPKITIPGESMCDTTAYIPTNDLIRRMLNGEISYAAGDSDLEFDRDVDIKGDLHEQMADRPLEQRGNDDLSDLKAAQDKLTEVDAKLKAARAKDRRNAEFEAEYAAFVKDKQQQAEAKLKEPTGESPGGVGTP